jgi:CMP-N-acetylneuraminic acid synthetase
MARPTGQVIAVIPARGGSRRFPRKNIALLAGRPLLSYAVEAARQASTIDGVYVSTEDDEIAEIAVRHGAAVPYRRPRSLSGDHVTADDVVAHLVRFLQDDQGLDISIVVLIQPTSPFVKAQHIDAAVDKLSSESDLDSVTTMAELDHRGHPYNLSFMPGDDRWEFIFVEERAQAKSRQAKPKALKFGNLFAAKVDTMLGQGRFGTSKGAVMIDPIYAWDIDYPWELHVAEYLLDRGLVDLTPDPAQATNREGT